ncbi:MAG: cytidylyltransferase domain-containing protein [Flavobacteriales bacterium]
MKVIAVIQARMGSTRLRGKTLMQISKYTLLDTVINSVKRNSFIDEVIVATSNNREDDLIEEHCKSNNISFVRGDSEDVLSRFITVAKSLNPNDIIIRVTADNPLNNKKATEKLFQKHKDEKNEYTYVDGLSHIAYEFINAGTLSKLENCTELESSDKEHVTLFIRRNEQLFKNGSLSPDSLNLKPILDKMLTVDSESDYNRFQVMKNEIDIDNEIDFTTVYEWLKRHNSNQ